MSKILVIFRYDDFSAISDLQLEEEILDFFNERNIGFTIGVVPFIKKNYLSEEAPDDLLPLTKAKESLLMEALQKKCEIALHGFSHIPIKSYFRYSEFETSPLKKQISFIKQAKDYLENLLSIKIKTFIPPFNSYDRNTIRALKLLNFKIISAGLWGYIPFRGINMVPSTCTLDDFGHILNIARKFINFSPIIVILFHPFDFHDEKQNLDRVKINGFKQIIEQCLIQKDIQIVTVKKLVDILKGRSSGMKFFFNKILEKISRPKLEEEPHPYAKIYWGIRGALYFTIKALLNSLDRR